MILNDEIVYILAWGVTQQKFSMIFNDKTFYMPLLEIFIKYIIKSIYID